MLSYIALVGVNFNRSIYRTRRRSGLEQVYNQHIELKLLASNTYWLTII